MKSPAIAGLFLWCLAEFHPRHQVVLEHELVDQRAEDMQPQKAEAQGEHDLMHLARIADTTEPNGDARQRDGDHHDIKTELHRLGEQSLRTTAHFRRCRTGEAHHNTHHGKRQNHDTNNHMDTRSYANIGHPFADKGTVAILDRIMAKEAREKEQEHQPVQNNLWF